MPDWSTAEWADGVEVTQEKGLANELGGSVNIEYEKEIFDHIKLTATGAFSLTGKFEFDYSGDGLKKCDLSLEPTLNAKITLSGAGNNDEGHKKLRKNKQPASVYLGKVTLCSVFVVNVDCAVYLRINAEGSATINMQILGGKYGFHYSPATSSMEKFKTRSAPKVSFDGKIEITCGLVPAVELHLSLLGKFMSMELFLGVKTAVTWSTQHVECVNIDIDFEISIELKFELDLEKKFGKKLKGFSFGKTFTIADFTIDIVDFHFENWKKVDSCSYGSNTVDFCTFTNTKLNKITVDSDTYIDEPKISLKNNKLLGWYTDKNFVNKWNFKQDAVTSDMTLYAKWENTAQTVLFKSEQLDENNKEIMADWTAEYVPGSQLVQPDIKVKHYRLLGWYTDPKLKAKDKWDFENDIMPNNSLTLYAKWEYDESYDPYANEGQNYTIQNGMLYFNGHVYKHIPQDTLFSAAKADCESQGGYLLTVTSKEEMDAVLAYVRNDCAQEALWLGINSSTLWEHWLTGEKVTYWNGDKPSSSSGQYNGIFFNNSTGTWSSIDNSQLRHYVIEWGDDYQVDPDFHSNQDENAVTYFDDSTGVSVVGFNGSSEESVISGIYDGKLVTSIADGAYRDNKTVTSVVIPGTVTQIGEYAFANCTSLKEIVIPDSVTSIGAHAFDGCTALEKVTLSSNMTTLPDHMFYNCTALKEVNKLEYYTAIRDYAFYGCASLKSVNLSPKLHEIGDYVFYACSSITKLSLPEALDTVDRYAFCGCSGLREIDIPSKMTRINENVFGDCSGLKTVTIPGSVTYIDDNAFRSTDPTFRVRLGSYAEVWCKKNGYKFAMADLQRTIRFHTGLAASDGNTPDTKDDDMMDNVYLEWGSHITEPEVTRDGYVLEGWYTDPDFTKRWNFGTDTVADEDITLYARWVEADTAYKFFVMNGMAYVTTYLGNAEYAAVPDLLGGYPVAGICKNAFSDHSNLKSIILPKTVASIEAGAFAGCSSLYTIAFAGENPFFQTGGNGAVFTADGKRLLCIPGGRTLVAYVVPDGVESIDDGAFSGQSNLARVEIPQTVTAIGENAFWLGAFLTLYGPVADCTAKTYAHDHGLGYNEYRVTFWDGDAELLSALVTAGETIESLTDVVNDYCTFGGWYRDADLTDAWDFEQDTMPAKDLNLYLKWNSDFAVSSSDHGLTITGYVGSSNQIRIPSEIDGTAVVAIADGAFVSTEEKPIASLDIPDSVTTIDTAAASGNPELVIVGNAGSAAESFAQTAGFAFEKRLYQIRYDSNGGTQIQPASYIAGEAVVQPAPVKRNYVFLGWYKDPGLADPWESTDVMPAEAVTLYAKWGLINKSIQGTFSYEMLHDGTISIAAYSGSSSMTNLTIPSEIDGYTVSAISDYAFSDDKYLLKISIPDTVTRIGAYAFADSAIREISGGSNVISLGEACFAGAAGLLQAFLPSGVTEIPDFCFSACTSITELALSSSIVSVGDYAFNGCSYLSSVTVPESVQTIGAYALAIQSTYNIF